MQKRSEGKVGLVGRMDREEWDKIGVEMMEDTIPVLEAGI